MDESKWDTPLYVTLEEPITVGVLCRCLTNLLLGALLGFALILFSAAPGGSPSGSPAQTPPASILLGLVVPVVSEGPSVCSSPSRVTNFVPSGCVFTMM